MVVGAGAPVVDKNRLRTACNLSRSLVEVNLHSRQAVVLFAKERFYQAVILVTVAFVVHSGYGGLVVLCCMGDSGLDQAKRQVPGSAPRTVCRLLFDTSQSRAFQFWLQ